MLIPELVKEFQNIIQKEYGLALSDKEASEIANNLTGYFDLLAKIHHRDRLTAEAPDLVRSGGSNQGL
ncbi:MAG: hypothetical protein UV68_C0041G0003 [Candidatus Collierbacteria bacterium GW2011_GWC2_43_12]|uniref:Uncharacterized protein n=1 Tax=Candidatus Collierbacteria bacterium GW2011_GWC2_43_12 TaxID=1618390 RepID=A0A0G1FBZ0_9BACT|nr:MAG: hypothetical protein UV68_C0041G0003 [Candidatus Collierbacteria bacterium GW2011_GWC2_43_12]